MFVVIFWLIGLAAGIFAVILNNICIVNEIANYLLYYQMIITLPMCGIFGFVGHVFKSDYVAGFIGWEKGNPFQKEIGFANLAYGLLSIGCIFYGREYYLAVIISFTIFYIGAACVHLKEIKSNKNLNPGNGFMTLPDFLLPLFIIILFVLSN